VSTQPGDHEPGVDPTDVLGRRIAGWVIDVVMFIALALAMAVVFGQRHRGGACDDLTRGHAVSQCFALGHNAYLVSGAHFWATTAIAVAWFVVIHGVVQGRTGRSPGKALCGVRVIGEDGTAPGIGRSLVRSACWVADGFPFLLGPVVGGVAMVSSRGHRRLGDLAGGTWVVDRRWAGPPPTMP
jgi:uncharacterized RDD family membrane protein YckC